MQKKPLKRFLSGLEFEFFLLNENGRVVNSADNVIKNCLKAAPKTPVTYEAAKCIVELNNYPEPEPEQTIQKMQKGLKVLLEVSEKLGIRLCPLGCYPGKFTPEMRLENRYGIQQKILGKEKFETAGKCIGFHFHHTLPKGVLDKEKLELKKLINSKLKTSLINAYNLAISVDPALSTIMASSPFFENKHLGKDSRVFVYRGGRKLKYMAGVYSNFLAIGGLPPYKQTLADLKFSIRRRKIIWEQEIKKLGLQNKSIDFYKCPLDIYWGPVRINPHDTLEQRGMDMNFLDNAMGITTCLNYIFERVQVDFLQVLPSDIGLEEPFKVEGNVLHIPPHTYVRNRLQYRAAKHGFNSKTAKEFTKRFAAFARQCIPANKRKIAKPVFDVVRNESSVSDEMLKFSKLKGFRAKQGIPDDFAAELALKSADDYLKSVSATEKILESFV